RASASTSNNTSRLIQPLLEPVVRHQPCPLDLVERKNEFPDRNRATRRTGDVLRRRSRRFVATFGGCSAIGHRVGQRLAARFGVGTLGALCTTAGTPPARTLRRRLGFDQLEPETAFRLHRD